MRKFSLNSLNLFAFNKLNVVCVCVYIFLYENLLHVFYYNTIVHPYLTYSCRSLKTLTDYLSLSLSLTKEIYTHFIILLDNFELVYVTNSKCLKFNPYNFILNAAIETYCV